ncbi:MAG TPA: signal recognition particle-docking protein FtsY [Candidatus Thalassarchaeaceae archaeon]|jgi:fused signal recognition particle receptor|nr:signal recognition particle-docking protein FtsY [Candidatus Thalassarchaeaceae archaeon]
MGLFDRFRSKVKDLGDSLDEDELTAEEGTDEAIEAIESRAELESTTEAENEWDDIEEIVSLEPPTEDEWDDIEEDETPSPFEELSSKKRKPTKSSTATRPRGSKVDLHILRSTTGRQLVSIEEAPRGSIGSSSIDLESGAKLEIDLGGGVVESGGRVIKQSAALDSLLEEMEMILLEADMGIDIIEFVLELLRVELVGNRLRKGADLAKVLEASLKRALRSLLKSGYWDLDETVRRLSIDEEGPIVLLVVGVNGVGKTTSVAKMAHRFTQQGHEVVLAAGDTFRAGAIDQLQTHADRLGVRCISSQRGGDPAAIARDAIDSARARGADIVIVDTAGRMQNKRNLMEELRKVHRIAQPHLVLFVADALAGNDAIEQATVFQEMLDFDGFFLCKLDTAKGGAALSIAHITGRPIVMVGVGQEYVDLHPFDPDWLLEEMFQ